MYKVAFLLLVIAIVAHAQEFCCDGPGSGCCCLDHPETTPEECRDRTSTLTQGPSTTQSPITTTTAATMTTITSSTVVVTKTTTKITTKTPDGTTVTTETVSEATTTEIIVVKEESSTMEIIYEAIGSIGGLVTTAGAVYAFVKRCRRKAAEVLEQAHNMTNVITDAIETVERTGTVEPANRLPILSGVMGDLMKTFRSLGRHTASVGDESEV